MKTALLLLTLVVAGCFSPSYPNGALQCASGDKPCPDGYHCNSGACWKEGTDPDLATSAPTDLAVVDLAPAEDLMPAPIDLAIPDGNHLGHATTASGGGVHAIGSAHQVSLSVGQHFAGKVVGAAHQLQLGVMFGTQSK
jgi:hypothetical protein